MELKLGVTLNRGKEGFAGAKVKRNEKEG